MTSGISPLYGKTERFKNAVMEQGVRFADPLCRNFPIGEVGGLKQKISMWVIPAVSSWVRP